MTFAISDLATTVRAMEPGDFGFAWETSLKVRQPRDVPWSTWLEHEGQRFREAMNAPGARVNVMESDGVLLGFAWWQGLVLRMVYVKRDLRGFGYGLELVGAERPVAVHRPNVCWRKWALRANVAWREV